MYSWLIIWGKLEIVVVIEKYMYLRIKSVWHSQTVQSKN